MELPVITLTELAGNDLPFLNTLQLFLAPWVEDLMIFWWSVWLMALAMAIRFVIVYGDRTTS